MSGKKVLCPQRRPAPPAGQEQRDAGLRELSAAQQECPAPFGLEACVVTWLPVTALRARSGSGGVPLPHPGAGGRLRSFLLPGTSLSCI